MARIKLKDTGCDSILMGHIHTPDLVIGEYYNTGDFCESNTYIIEHLDGRIELKWCKNND